MTTASEERAVDVAIIGGGIGGLATAVALRRAGIEAQVFEQTAVLAEIGGAVVIREPSLELLGQWGLAGAFRPVAVRFTEIELRTAGGDVVGSGPVQVEPGEPGWAYSVHRADLHNLLRATVPDQAIHLGHRLTTVTESGPHVEAVFGNGARVRAKVLVGADGLRSVVRPLVDDAPLEFVGLVTCRSIAPADVMPADLPNDRLRLWTDGARQVLTLPLRGGRQIAIDSVLLDLGGEPPAELWTATTPVEELLRNYEGFDPRIVHAIRAGSSPASVHPVYDRKPAPRWSTDRITLLGDAAHPMAPMRGQGANQAIQDAAFLASELSGATDRDVSMALRRYQDVRAPYTAAIQEASRTPPPWAPETNR